MKLKWPAVALFLTVVATAMWSMGSSTAIEIASVPPTVPIERRCWVSVSLDTLSDDLRGGSETFARLEIYFWGGEVVTVPLAVPGETLRSEETKDVRVFAPSLVYPNLPQLFNGVRRVQLTYKLDPGDGLLLRPDSWLFRRPRIGHYCRNIVGTPDLSNFEDFGRTTIYLNEPIVHTVTGSNTITLYDDDYVNPSVCRFDGHCDDGIRCNGTETCRPGKPGSDAHGCRAGSPVSCSRNKTCFEPFNVPATWEDLKGAACWPSFCSNPDRDGDGAIRFECGGSDCNDNDRSMFPDNSEHWDTQNKDNDCNRGTNGYFGLVPFGVVRQAQKCDGETHVIVIKHEYSGYESMLRVACPGGSVCVPQPSDEGVCAGRPDGYVAPPLFPYPVEQTGYEPGWLQRNQPSVKGIPGAGTTVVGLPTPKPRPKP